jgi:hypothetical protein
MLLRRDIDGMKIQGVGYMGTTHVVNITTEASRNGQAFTTDVIRVVGNQDMWIKAGDGTVAATASNVFIPAGVVEYINVGTNTHLGVHGTVAGYAYITEVL